MDEAPHYQSEPQALNTWLKIKIQQVRIGEDYYIEIYLADLLVYKVLNKNPKIFDNVKLFVSNPWNEEDKGSIRGLTVKNTGELTFWESE